ncbi:MAG TPA: YCF48-related protein, partial [Longimicrobiales bacterium]|nr:YCF48-related protein [Longimicrobiales bacterium]
MNIVRSRIPVTGIVLTAGLIVGGSLAATPLEAQRPTVAQDGGWARMLSPQLEKYHQPEVNAVHFFNRHIGWAVGGHARDRTGRNQETFVFRTADGGASWDRLTLYDGQEHVPTFVDIGFADANHGWLLSGGDLVLRTRDGGGSWEAVEPLPRGSGRTLLVLGPDAVMVGSTSTNGRQINITTDGGRSWRNSTVSPGGRDHVADLAFVPPASFFAVVASAMQNAGGIYRSDDGGRSWAAVAEGRQPLHTIAFSESGRNGVAAGVGAVYSTRDGGDSWQRVAAPGARYAAGFLDEDRVVAFGSGPSLLISGDGGRTWSPGQGPRLGTAALVDVQIVDPGWWLVSGGRGAHDLFRYEDPSYAGTMVRGALTLPEAMGNRDGTALPPGRYDFRLRHSGLDHGFWLSLREPAEGIETGVEPDEAGELEPDQYACDPCEGYFPA